MYSLRIYFNQKCNSLRFSTPISLIVCIMYRCICYHDDKDTNWFSLFLFTCHLYLYGLHMDTMYFHIAYIHLLIIFHPSIIIRNSIVDAFYFLFIYTLYIKLNCFNFVWIIFFYFYINYYYLLLLWYLFTFIYYLKV